MSLIRKLSIEYVFEISIAVGSIVCILGFLVADMVLQTELNIISMVFGTVIGIFFCLDQRINNAGDWAKDKLKNTPLCKGPFADAVVTSSVLFGVGTMAILGSIKAGLNQEYGILFTKSIMDFSSAIAFSAALGPGVIFSSIPILIFQGGITLLAGVAEPFLTPEVITEMSAVGGPIFIGMAINLLPILMTLINVVSSAIYAKGFPLKTKIQLYGVALIFLVFLYNYFF